MKKIIPILMCLFCVSAGAQPQSTLLQKYRAMALDYNHDLKAAEKNIAASLEFEDAARADAKPKLAATGSFQYTGNPMELNANLSGVPLSFQGQTMNYGASVTLLQPVYAGGRLLENIRMAQHQSSLALSNVDLIRSSICFQTDIQYWNTVARYEMVEIASDFHASMASLVATIKDRVDVGLVNPQDLLMAEVKLNDAEYQVLQAKATFETGRMALNSLIGMEVGSETEIESEVPLLLVGDSLFQCDGSARAEIRMAYDQIKLAESSLKLNDSKYKPQFYLGVDGSYSSPGYNFRSDMNPNYAIYTKVSVPIFEWGKRRNEKNAWRQQVGMAEDNLAKVEDVVILEISTARTALQQALLRIALAQSSLEKARENELKALERYSEGEVSIVEVIDAQVYRQTSQINYVQAKVAAQGHYSELVKALNFQ